MGKNAKKKGLKKLAVAVSCADVEAAFLARFAALGMGLGTDSESMDVARAVCRSRAAECADVLDYLAR